MFAQFDGFLMQQFNQASIHISETNQAKREDFHEGDGESIRLSVVSWPGATAETYLAPGRTLAGWANFVRGENGCQQFGF